MSNPLHYYDTASPQYGDVNEFCLDKKSDQALSKQASMTF